MLSNLLSPFATINTLGKTRTGITNPLGVVGLLNKLGGEGWELVDVEGGSFYLPYQIHATRAQFLAAYPRADAYFAVKTRVDPDYKFRNRLWQAYYRDA